MHQLSMRLTSARDVILAVSLVMAASLYSQAQTKSRISIHDIYKEAQKPGYDPVVVENKIVSFFPFHFDSVRLTRPLAFYDCELETVGDNFAHNFWLLAPSITVRNVRASFLSFTMCRIDTLLISGLSGGTSFNMTSSRIARLGLELENDVTNVSINENQFTGLVSVTQNNPAGSGGAIIGISNSTFSGAARIRGTYSNITMQENTFSSSVSIEDVSITNWIIISENSFEELFEVSALTIAIPENVKFKFSQIKGEKLTSFERELIQVPGSTGSHPLPFKTNAHEYFSEDQFYGPDSPYGADSISFKKVLASAGDSLYSHHAGFDDLLYTYQRLYNIYKIRGDLKSMNECYVEMKNIQTNQFKYLYTENPAFDSFFRWRLSQLMKVYTEHGTDPAKAMTISFWIVVLFGIFYIFFPSDWDVTSKSKLVSDFRVFIQKNEHGYFKPFIRMTGGLIVSFINAVTLSLNAFTTLGFGNIPTHGLARYVCVLQGFIGWFLLSIFTVALINQVLA